MKILNISLAIANTYLDVFVYDNSPNIQYEDKTFLYENFNITYHHDPSNLGVSKAYNFGSKFALEHGKKSLFLLDQDTKFPENTIEVLNNEIAKDSFESESLYAPLLYKNKNLLSPCAYYFKRGSELTNIKIGKQLIKNKNFLNSGLLISLVAFVKVGGYNENVPLYFSDFVFIDRFRKVYKTFVALELACNHSMSSNDYSNLEEAVYRFKLYCDGAKCASKDSLLSQSIYLFTTIARGFLMSIRLKNSVYLFTAFKVWF